MMKKITRLLRLLAAGMMLAQPAAATASEAALPRGNARSTAAEVRNPDSFVHLTTRSWFTFDPAASFDAVSFIVTGNVYEPLIAFKSVLSSEEFMPFIAEEVPSRENKLITEDGLRYTFPIREGVRFHDGRKLTPEDVRYSLLRFMLADIEGGPSALLLKPVLGVYSTRTNGRITVNFEDAARAVRVEEGHLVVTLAAPDTTFLKVLASLPIIVSKSWAVENGEWDGAAKTWKKFNNRPVERSAFHQRINGTGPFRLAKAGVRKSELMLERHDEYWRTPADLERVFLRVVPKTAVRLMMLENGDADAGYFEDRDFTEVQMLDGVKIVDNLPLASLGEVLFFTFAAEKGSKLLGSGKLDGKGIPPDFFNDPRVREGFAYAIDYEAYFKRGLGVRGRRAAGPIPPRLLPDQGRAKRSFNLKKAESALRKAHGGKLWKKGFSLPLAYSTSNANRVVLAELLKAGLEKINPKFRVLLSPMSSRTLYSEAEAHRLPLFIAGYYSDYPDPHSFAFGMLHSAGYYPKAQRYSNAKIDRLIDEAAGTLSPKKRAKIYRKVSNLASKDLAQIYTYWPARFTAGRDWVVGLDSSHNISNLNLNNFPYFYAYAKKTGASH